MAPSADDDSDGDSDDDSLEGSRGRGQSKNRSSSSMRFVVIKLIFVPRFQLLELPVSVLISQQRDVVLTISHRHSESH